MGSFFAGLQSLIITVQRNMLSSFFTTVMIIALICVWSARGNISTFLERNPTPEIEKQRFNESIVADGLIREALDHDRKIINADRVLIRQFHNSKADLTGLPFASISTTYAAMAPGVSLEAAAYGPYPLSTMNEQLKIMWVDGQEPKCVRMDISAVKDTQWKSYWEKNGAKVGYTCPILNLRGQPIGIIGAEYLTAEKNRPTDEIIVDILKKTGEKSAGYLDAVVTSEKKPWYERLLSQEK